jgi:hypothetical protein
MDNVKFGENVSEIIATVFIFIQFVSLLFFKEINNSDIIYDNCLLITFEFILLMANVFLSVLYQYFLPLLLCMVGFGFFFLFFLPNDVKS